MKKNLDIFKELKEHLPFTLTATFLSVIIASFLLIKKNFLIFAVSLFDLLHPTHILFSSIVSAAIFYNHKKNFLLAVVSSIIISVFVGSISDIIFPYFGGLLFNIKMPFHLPLVEEPLIILGVSTIGAIFGVLTRKTKYPHFLHVLISIFASLLYIFSYSTDFSLIKLFFIFVITTISVVIPCCLSDLVLPVLFQRKVK